MPQSCFFTLQSEMQTVNEEENEVILQHKNGNDPCMMHSLTAVKLIIATILIR